MEHQITISKTARYYSYGNPETADNIWIVLHGYSQLAKFFIRKFHGLDPEKNYIIAPEGFHRFYRNGTSGRVGATWMTKEARLDDISDNIDYLNQLAEKVLEEGNFKRRILLGFSQGGATASRWHNLGNFHAQHFILWGSVYAEDIKFDEDKPGLFQSDNYFVVGREDVYFKERLGEVIDYLNDQEFITNITLYDGGHDIDEDTLLELTAEISTKEAE